MLIKMLVLAIAIGMIAFIVWWFFKNRTSEGVAAEMNASDQTQNAEVVVNGGYTPNQVVLKKGVPAQIIFHRKDPSGCLEQVVFPDFGINAALPVNEDYTVEIDTSKAGEFDYACGMNMFHGKVVVEP